MAVDLRLKWHDGRQANGESGVVESLCVVSAMALRRPLKQARYTMQHDLRHVRLYFSASSQTPKTLEAAQSSDSEQSCPKRQLCLAELYVGGIESEPNCLCGGAQRDTKKAAVNLVEVLMESSDHVTMQVIIGGFGDSD